MGLFRSRLACAMAPSLFLLGASGTFAQPGLFEGAKPLTDPLDPQVAAANDQRIGMLDLALSVVDAMGKEPAFPPETRDAVTQVAADMRVLMERGAIFHSDPDAIDTGKALAETNGPGTDPARKAIVFRANLLGFLGGNKRYSPCSTDFLLLVNSVIHEGIHLRQDTTDKIDAAAAAPAGAERNVAVIRAKIRYVSNEAKAYNFEATIKLQEAAALRAIEGNLIANRDPMDGVPSWANVWKDCSILELRSLAGTASSRASDILVRVGAYAKHGLDPITLEPGDLDGARGRLSKMIDAASDRPIDDVLSSDEDIKDFLQKVTNDALFRPKSIGRGPLPRLDLPATSSISAFDGTVDGRPVPEIRFPQDVLVLQDSRGFPHLLIAGFSNIREPSGTIVRMPAEFGAVVPVFDTNGSQIGLRMDPLSFSNDHHTTIVRGDPRLAHPTSFAVRSDGAIFVWDPDGPSLYQLLDTNGDLLPDDLDFTNRIRIPRGGGTHEFDGRADAEFDGPLLKLRIRAVAGSHFGSWPILFATDHDEDGSFDAWRVLAPEDRFSRPPVVLAGKRAGARFAFVTGAHPHRVEVRVRKAWEPPALEQVLARGTIGDGGTIRLHLSRALEEHEIVRAHDLENARSSELHTVVAAGAEIALVDPEAISTLDSTRVTIRGIGLDLVSSVEVDGERLAFRRLGNEAIVLSIPPQGRHGPFSLGLRTPEETLKRALFPLYDY